MPRQDFITRASNVFARLDLPDTSTDSRSWAIAGKKYDPLIRTSRGDSGLWQSPTASASVANKPRRRAVGVPGALLCCQCRAPQPEQSRAFYCDVQHRPLFARNCEHGPFCSHCHNTIIRQTLPSCICRALVGSWREEDWPVPVVFGPAPPPITPGSSSTANAKPSDGVQQNSAVHSVPSSAQMRLEQLRTRVAAKEESRGSNNRASHPAESAASEIRSSASNPETLGTNLNGRGSAMDIRSGATSSHIEKSSMHEKTSMPSDDVGQRGSAMDVRSGTTSTHIEKSSMRKETSMPSDDVGQRGSAMEVRPGTGIIHLEKSSVHKETSMPNDDVSQRGSAMEVRPGTGITHLEKSSVHKQTSMPNDDVGQRVPDALRHAVHNAAAHRAATAPTPPPQIFKRRLDGDTNHHAKSRHVTAIAEDTEMLSQRGQKGLGTEFPTQPLKKTPAGGAKKRRITAGASDGESDSIDSLG